MNGTAQAVENKEVGERESEISQEPKAREEIPLEKEIIREQVRLSMMKQIMRPPEIGDKRSEKDKAKDGPRAFVLNPGYFWNPWRSYPRNLSCFCGTGKKFKKCCASRVQDAIQGNEKEHKEAMARMIAHVEKLEAKGLPFIVPRRVNVKSDETHHSG